MQWYVLNMSLSETFDWFREQPLPTGVSVLQMQSVTLVMHTKTGNIFIKMICVYVKTVNQINK